jgi:hypothetical protein
MLTLHPDASGGWLHGNVVGASGVRHLSLPWSPEHGLEVEGRPIAGAVTAARLSRVLEVGEGRTVPVVLVAADLAVSETAHRYVRVGAGEWRIESVFGEAAVTILRIDERGIPAGLPESREWPLELD